MWSDKEEGEKIYVVEAERLRDALERERVYLQTINLQEVFGGLGEFHDITDTVSGKPPSEGDEEVN